MAKGPYVQARQALRNEQRPPMSEGAAGNYEEALGGCAGGRRGRTRRASSTGGIRAASKAKGQKAKRGDDEQEVLHSKFLS